MLSMPRLRMTLWVSQPASLEDADAARKPVVVQRLTVWPSALVATKLERWRDRKFGLLMHWGPYSQWGVVESWSICPEDEDWCRRDPVHGATYTEYLRNYEGLQRTFDLDGGCEGRQDRRRG